MDPKLIRYISADEARTRPPEYFVGSVLSDEALRALAEKILKEPAEDATYPKPFLYRVHPIVLIGFAAENTVYELSPDDIAWLRAVAVALKTNPDLRAAASICLFIPEPGAAWAGALGVVRSFVPYGGDYTA